MVSIVGNIVDVLSHDKIAGAADALDALVAIAGSNDRKCTFLSRRAGPFADNRPAQSLDPRYRRFATSSRRSSRTYPSLPSSSRRSDSSSIAPASSSPSSPADLSTIPRSRPTSTTPSWSWDLRDTRQVRRRPGGTRNCSIRPFPLHWQQGMNKSGLRLSGAWRIEI